MIILGLTGSIAMGKSTVAAMMRDIDIAVHDSDLAVHRLLDSNLPAIMTAFPQVCDGGMIDRSRLGGLVFNDGDKKEILESILHPLVRKSQNEFIAGHKERGAEIICLDIPLLFETGADARVDYTITVNAPLEIQRSRALSRPNMSAEKFEAILSAQMPNAEKCAQSDYVINTGVSLEYSLKELKSVIEKIKANDI